ncbi:hypothetical protein SDC9_172093 [bioreactor metagenome]|uniref:Uncharacterized protein n=1 Tax=bioreactor metagenome TaxID=1076179 RepID=A0A645GCQ5_9ZZZZ
MGGMPQTVCVNAQLLGRLLEACRPALVFHQLVGRGQVQAVAGQDGVIQLVPAAALADHLIIRLAPGDKQRLPGHIQRLDLVKHVGKADRRLHIIIGDHAKFHGFRRLLGEELRLDKILDAARHLARAAVDPDGADLDDLRKKGPRPARRLCVQRKLKIDHQEIPAHSLHPSNLLPEGGFIHILIILSRMARGRKCAALANRGAACYNFLKK